MVVKTLTRGELDRKALPSAPGGFGNSSRFC